VTRNATSCIPVRSLFKRTSEASECIFSACVCLQKEPLKMVEAEYEDTELLQKSTHDKVASALEQRLQGVWHQHLERLKQTEDDLCLEEHGLQYSVPRIVAIGEESSGKSSTLERLAMLEFFPSDRRLCTRMPIELRLRYRPLNKLPDEFKESGFVLMSLVRSPDSNLDGVVQAGPLKPSDVETQVRDWMEQVVREQNSELVGISKDRLVIELYSTRKLSLDLIDLPGIVAGSIRNEPSDMMDQTRELSSSFLNDPAHPHTFVVAIVSAAETRVRNSQAMELVQRFHKENMTIGTLTMSDLSGDGRFRDDPYVKLKERLKGEADDLPDLKLGYVALMNRDTTLESRPSLEEMNSIEAAWFAEHAPDLQETCGINALTQKLVNMLEAYTSNTWYRLERERLMFEREKAKECLARLGAFIPGGVDDLIRQTMKLLPGSDKIWTYYRIEQCCANICTPKWIAFGFPVADKVYTGPSPNKLISCVQFKFEIASQEKMPRRMSGWSVHSQQTLGAEAEDSSPPPSSGTFVFGNVNNNFTFGGNEGRREFRKLRRQSWASARREQSNSSPSGDSSSDVDELVSFFTNAAATVPPGHLIFCGEEISDNNYIGIYGEAVNIAFGGKSGFARITVSEQIMRNPLSHSFHLDLVNSPTFSEKLKSFCLQAFNVGPRQHEFSAFNEHGFVLSEENLGLPNDANIDVSRCFFWRGSVQRNEQKFVVLTFPATTELNRSFFDVEPYEFTPRINEFIRSMVVKSCEKVISAHVDTLLSYISLCDRRFTTFHAALGQILHMWSNDVSKAVITRMDAWLSCFFSRDTPSHLPIPTHDSVSKLFMQAVIEKNPSQAEHHTFCNPLTIAVSMTLAEHLQYDSLTKYISSDGFKSSLLALEEESLLIKETCAKERHALDVKVQAITEMLNVMNQVFMVDGARD